MSIVLGIDPGSQFTGWGIVQMVGNELRHLDHGLLKLGSKPMPLRLRDIYATVFDLIPTHHVDRFAIESSFVADNPQTAIKLGQARGVAIAAAAARDLSVEEYSPRAIKQATVGSGNATKEQIQFMIRMLLKLDEAPVSDCADALAVAICDLNTLHYRSALQRVR